MRYKMNINMQDLSYRGQSTKDFEKLLSDYIGAYVVCTNTGTSALHLALMLSGVEFSRVIVPSITYVATANVVTYVNSDPVFCDVKDDLNIDVEKLDRWLGEQDKILLNSIEAIMPVDVLGNPCDMFGVLELAKKYKLKVIEDSSQALGSWYHGKHCGTMGDFGVISFNGNKIVTSGGGGAILCRTKKARDKAVKLSTVSKVMSRKQCYHDAVGYNYRLSAWNAQLGIEQFYANGDYLQTRKFASGILPIVHNGWKRIDKTGSKIWTPLHKLPMYRNNMRTDCSNAERLAKTVRIV
jgi:dTDP-4-amino-4,6-dideoxygalactose transaminase